MLKRIKIFLRKYPLTLLCIVLIWVLCLVKPPSHLPDMGLGADKWAHVLMYLGTCSVLWWEYFRCHFHSNRPKVFLLAVVLPIGMSGVIELAQHYLTTNRSGDVYDFVANALGVCLAAAGAWVCKKIKCILKNNHSSHGR